MMRDHEHSPAADEGRVVAAEIGAMSLAHVLRAALFISCQVSAPSEEVDQLLRLVARADARYRAARDGDEGRPE
jgi:hypothetical protein